MMLADLKVILIHGNGGSTGNNYWFPEIKKSLEEMGVTVLNPTFPDNDMAHESIWTDYLLNKLKADENTIIIGHSSGGVLAMRVAEQHKLYGTVLFGVNYTDLGDDMEKEAGYYNRPWEWEKIRGNQNWIIQFASTDDPFIPIDEPRLIKEKLQSDYYEFNDKGHFMIESFPNLFPIIKKKLESIS